MSRAAVLEALKAGPATSTEIAAVTGLPARQASPTLQQLYKAGRIYRSVDKVRLRKQSPGAYLYSLEPFKEKKPRE